MTKKKETLKVEVKDELEFEGNGFYAQPSFKATVTAEFECDKGDYWNPPYEETDEFELESLVISEYGVYKEDTNLFRQATEEEKKEITEKIKEWLLDYAEDHINDFEDY